MKTTRDWTAARDRFFGLRQAPAKRLGALATVLPLTAGTALADTAMLSEGCEGASCNGRADLATGPPPRDGCALHNCGSRWAARHSTGRLRTTCQRSHGIPVSLLAVLAVLLGAAPVLSQGIPEPDLVLYGAVEDTAGRLLRVGSLSVQIRPVGGGRSLTLAAALQSIHDQFSYVVRAKCETEIPGFALSEDALKLGGSYHILNVRVNDQAATVLPSRQSDLTLSIGPSDRGLLFRVDFSSAVPPSDDYDEWIRLIFLEGSPSAARTADPDGDGLTNEQEWRAGTLPNDENSVLEFVKVEADGGGGVSITWRSVPGTRYTVRRSTELNQLQSFSDLAKDILAAGEETSYHDSSGVGGDVFFYLIEVQ